MTIQDAIKLLPIEEELKLTILRMYDYMEPAQQLTVQRIAWNNYDLLREEKMQINTEIQEQKVKDGLAEFGEDYYKQIKDRSNLELKEEISTEGSKADLATARQAMQQIVKEIKDNKTAKKEQKEAKNNPQPTN